MQCCQVHVIHVLLLLCIFLRVEYVYCRGVRIADVSIHGSFFCGRQNLHAEYLQAPLGLFFVHGTM